MSALDYRAFLEGKVTQAQAAGFACDIEEVRSHLVDGRPMRDHVPPIVKWAVEGGRRALFEAFGLHKTMQQLEIVRLMMEKARGDGAIILPLGVRQEFFADDGRGKLPRTFMALAPGASDPAIWDDIVRMRTLNAEQVRKGAEKHVCPLQFDIVDRLIDFFSMPGELVFDPFAGLGTVPLRAIKLGRRGRGVDLNPDYFDFACQFLRDAEAEMATPTLFDLLAAEAA